MWWKKSSTKSSSVSQATIDSILNLIKILHVKVVKTEAEVESIQGKLKKKIYKGDDEAPSSTERFNYNDGFDEIRRMKKLDGA